MTNLNNIFSQDLQHYVAHKNHRIGKIHFIGIGGSGMNGIAKVLCVEKYQISGSDLDNSPVIDELRAMGIEIHIGHNPSNLQGCSVVVVSSAIKEDNPEVIAARELRIPIMRRAEMLAEIMRFRIGITISGTHGKTTTTAMTASIFWEAGLDPTFINGGIIKAYNATAALGKGKFLITEADESDASFLHLTPITSVVTNIEADHMENYGDSFEKMKESYLSFLQNVPFYGLIVACGDYATVQELIPQIGRKVITYGFNETNDYQIFDYQGGKFDCSFKIKHLEQIYSIKLGVPGKHNACNATAAMIVALDEDIPFHKISKALLEFNGTGRRFDYLGCYKINQADNVTIIDDYGHHPTELQATIETARTSFPGQAIAMVFEPHRYSRTKYFAQEFAQVLAQVDLLMLTQVYPAGETASKGLTSQQLAQIIESMGTKVHLISQTNPEQIQQVVESLIESDNVLLCQGAGLISRHIKSILPQWQQKTPK